MAGLFNRLFAGVMNKHRNNVVKMATDRFASTNPSTTGVLGELRDRWILRTANLDAKEAAMKKYVEAAKMADRRRRAEETMKSIKKFF